MSITMGNRLLSPSPPARATVRDSFQGIESTNEIQYWTECSVLTKEIHRDVSLYWHSGESDFLDIWQYHGATNVVSSYNPWMRIPIVCSAKCNSLRNEQTWDYETPTPYPGPNVGWGHYQRDCLDGSNARTLISNPLKTSPSDLGADMVRSPIENPCLNSSVPDSFIHGLKYDTTFVAPKIYFYWLVCHRTARSRPSRLTLV